MKFMLKLATVISGITLVGICNDTATFPQILLTVLVSGIIIAVSLIVLSFLYREQFSLDFYDEQGHHKHIKAYNIIGKWYAMYNYHKLGYRLCRETVYWEED